MTSYECGENTLPTISFIGGEKQDFSISMFLNNTESYDLSDCTAYFSLAEWINKANTVISKTMYVSKNNLSIILESNETIDLSGKYIYQITIKKDTNTLPILCQGVVYITKNIDKTVM